MISVETFAEKHVPAAARLFADAYARCHAENDLLPTQFSNPHVIEPMLASILYEHPGAVALQGSEVAGYLIGYSGIPGFFGRGAGAYVPVFGHGSALSQDPAQLYSALYAHLATMWVDRGCHSHAITYLAPSNTDAKDLESALFALGFGLGTIDAIRSVQPIEVPVEAAIGDITVRRAGLDDLDAIKKLDEKLRTHLRAGPIFLYTHPVAEPDLPVNFLSEGITTFIAWNEGAPIAGLRAVLNAGPGCELLNVESSLGINFAYTDAAMRGSGIATLLLNAALKWGANNGMVRCVVDFESANPPARRFWHRHFRPTFHSVIRRIDDRMP